MTLTDAGTLVPDATDDGRMPLDWLGPQWDGDEYRRDAERVVLSPTLEHLDGE